MGPIWDLGCILNPMQETNLVSFGINILVQTTSLAILEVATDALLTPFRMYKWIMSTGNDPGRGFALERWIEYNGPQFSHIVNPFPGFSDLEFGIDDIMKMDELSDDQLLHALLYKGRFWVWMRPDRYSC